MKNGIIYKDTTDYIKGLSSLGVLIHHIYQFTHFTNNIYLSLFFQLLGFLCVCIFFFCSGFGLGKSLNKKEYKNHFFRYKIMPLYLFEIFLILLSFFFYLLFNIDISFFDVCLSFLFGKTIVVLGWYLQVILLFYIFFYISFIKVCNRKRSIFLLTTLLIIFVLLCNFTNLSITWYEGTFCFLFGVLLSIYDKQVIPIFTKYRFLFLFLFFSVFLVSLYLEKNYFDFIKCFAAICWIGMVVMLIILFGSHQRLFNKYIIFIGNYSLELYVAQGFYLYLYKYNVISNLFSFYFFMFPCIIFIVYVLSSCFQYMKRLLLIN